MANYPDIGVEFSGHVATIEIQRPPNNFFDVVLINSIADALHDLDKNDQCRAVVLAAQGKAFCAGANFGDGSTLNKEGQRPGEAMTPIGHIYIQAVRLFRSKKPIVGAIHGAAVGGGLGLSMVADFRVACPETRFVGNFTRLGFHPGFGLTHTLPAVVGQQNAAMMFYTSRRVTGEEAFRMGLADVLVPQDQVRAAARTRRLVSAKHAPRCARALRIA
jgi:enoyl-CoA hydratase/carnithine racemase